jgi:hypothetical protein
LLVEASPEAKQKRMVTARRPAFVHRTTLIGPNALTLHQRFYRLTRVIPGKDRQAVFVADQRHNR